MLLHPSANLAGSPLLCNVGLSRYFTPVCVSGAPDNFKRPRSLKSYACHLDNISVTLKPSLLQFEEELLRQLNADCGKTEVGNVDDMPKIKIEERYLQVGY